MDIKSAIGSTSARMGFTLKIGKEIVRDFAKSFHVFDSAEACEMLYLFRGPICLRTTK
jgi:hypothetical protein